MGGGGLKKKLFFLNFVHVYLLFRYFLPLEKNGGLYSCELESHECFLPSLVKIGSVVLEKKIFKFRQYIFTFLLLTPLGKRRGHSFEQT